MAELPPEISTALVHMDAPLSFIGEPGRLHVEILPSVSLVWAATGTPVVNFEDMMDLADGQALEIQLPHTDQDGFLDGAGNTITGWYYTVKITYEKDGQLRVFPERDFQVLVGQAEVDLALVPAGEAAVPQVAPVLTVTSIDGFTGPVSLEELGLHLVDNTPDASKPISTAAQAALDLKVNISSDTLLEPTADGEYGVNLIDTADSLGIALHVDHYGDGIGFDIRNRPGAGMAQVLHQYANSTAVRWDNTGTGPMLVIAQTHNEIMNPESLPDSSALGDAFRQVDWQGNIWAKLDGRGALVLTPPSDQLSETLRIIGNTTSTKQSLRVTHNAPSTGVQIEQGALAADNYPLLVGGLKYGAEINATSDGGRALRVRKTGAGAGTGLAVINDGTGATATFGSTAAQVKSQVNAAGEFEHTVSGAGVILKSPNGTRFRVTVDDSGALTTTSL